MAFLSGLGSRARKLVLHQSLVGRIAAVAGVEASVCNQSLISQMIGEVDLKCLLVLGSH